MAMARTAWLHRSKAPPSSARTDCRPGATKGIEFASRRLGEARDYGQIGQPFRGSTMSILEAARRHFGPRWKPSVRVIGGPGQFKQKLAELQKEIRHLQHAYERLQLADLQQPD